MRLPDLLVIGAAKAGTSAFYRYIEQHPQIYASPIKEPHFFGLEGENNLFNAPPGIEAKENKAIRHIDNYGALFQAAPAQSLIVEASVSYLYLPKAAQRIKHYLPKVKMITMLRNPVERAYSSFLYLGRDGREPLSTLAEGLAAEKERIKENWGFLYRYTDFGLYSEQLARYFKEFDSNQIRIFLYDDFKANPHEVIKQTFEFVGIDSSFQPDMSRRFNVSGLPKNKILHKLIAEGNILKSMLKPIIPSQLRYRLKEGYYDKSLTKPTLPEETRQNLIDFFREDILKTQELLGRDLSKWLK